MFPAVAVAMAFSLVALVLEAMSYVSAFLGFTHSSLHYGASIVECIFDVLVVLACAVLLFVLTVVVLFALPGELRSKYHWPCWLYFACLAGSIDCLLARSPLGIRPCLHLASILFDNIPEQRRMEDNVRQARATRERKFKDITHLRESIKRLERKRDKLREKLPGVPDTNLPLPTEVDPLPTYYVNREEEGEPKPPSVFRRFLLGRYDARLEWLQSVHKALTNANPVDKLSLEKLKRIESELKDEIAALVILVARQQRKPPTPKAKAKETVRRRDRDPTETAMAVLRLKGYQRAAEQKAQERAARYQPTQPHVAAAIAADLASSSTSGQNGVAAMYLPSPANCLMLQPQQLDLAAIPAATQPMVEWPSTMEEKAEECIDVDMIDVDDAYDSDVEMADVNDEEMPTGQMALVALIPPVLAPAALQGAPVQFLDVEMDLDERESVPEASIAHETTTTDHGLQVVEFSGDMDINMTFAATDPSVEVPTPMAGFAAQTVAPAAASQPTSANTVWQSEPAISSPVSQQMPSGPLELPPTSVPAPANSTRSDEEEAAEPANDGNGIWFFDTSRTPVPAPATSPELAPPNSPSSVGSSELSTESEEPVKPEGSDDESSDDSDDESSEDVHGNLGQPTNTEVQPTSPIAAAPGQGWTFSDKKERDDITSTELLDIPRFLTNVMNNYLLGPCDVQEDEVQTWRQEAEDDWTSRSTELRLSLNEDHVMYAIQDAKREFLVPWLNFCLRDLWTRDIQRRLRQEIIGTAWNSWSIRLDDLEVIPMDD